MANGVRPAASCAANVVIPWSKLTLNDPHFNASNGFPAHPVYVEAVDFLPGLAGESRDFDANGPYIRILGTGGTLTYSLQPGLFGQALAPLQGEQPQSPPGQHAPPLQPNVPCETQQPITDLSAPTGGPAAADVEHLSAPGASLRWTSAATRGPRADPATGRAERPVAGHRRDAGARVARRMRPSRARLRGAPDEARDPRALEGLRRDRRACS